MFENVNFEGKNQKSCKITKHAKNKILKVFVSLFRIENPEFLQGPVLLAENDECPDVNNSDQERLIHQSK